MTAHKHLCSKITHILCKPYIYKCNITDIAMLFYPFAIFLLGQMQQSLETQHGSVPIIAIVAIFIALDFSRVENFCLFLLLLSHIQLPCNLVQTAEPDRAPLYHETGTKTVHATYLETHTHGYTLSPECKESVYSHALMRDNKGVF